MITRLCVDNFKALNDFEINLHPFTVIVGNNTSGKSTILQVIDFLSSIVTEDFNVVLERRGWRVSDIKSKLTKASKSRITISCDMLLDVADKKEEITWELVLNTLIQKNQIELISEKVFKKDYPEEELLSFSASGKGFMRSENGTVIQIVGISQIQSSFLKMLADSKENQKEFGTLVCMKRFLSESDSFELLSPDKMRLSSRGSVESIGSAGEKLPSFIKSMTSKQKESFGEKMQWLFGERVTSIDAQTKGKPGWTQIISTEKYKDKSIAVESKNMSDGMLRLLAFLAVSEIDKTHVIMLLDEIENGINIEYAEKVVDILRGIYQEKENQLVVTTHSAVFVDYVNKEDIVYLYRDMETGYTKAVALFENTAINEKLRYLYPGEVLMNMSNEDIVKELLG